MSLTRFLEILHFEREVAERVRKGNGLWEGTDGSVYS